MPNLRGYLLTLLPSSAYGLLIWVALIALVLAYWFPFSTTIDVGTGGDSPFIQGFSFRDRLPDRDVRWTTGRAELRFWGLGNTDGTLTLRLAAPRPSGTAHLTVFANGSRVGEETVTGAFRDYTFAISRNAIGPSGDLIVALDSDLFQQPPDPRSLGLLVDAAMFTAAGPLVPPPVPLLYEVALALLCAVVLNVWTGRVRLAVAGGIATVAGEAGAILAARVPMAAFSGPAFWCLLLAVGAAWLLTRILRRVAPTLPVRPMFGVMLAALVLRLLWAFGPGFIVDVQDYVVWSYKVVTFGLGTAYVPYEGLWMVDQFPGLVYVPAVMGALYRALFAPDFLYPAVAGDPLLRALSDNPAVLADPLQRAMLRVPFMVADVLTGALILALLWKSLPRWGAWAGALAYWLNPVIVWNSAYWGQTDSLHTLLSVAALALVQARRAGPAFFVYALALLTKPQAAVFGPLLLLLVFRNERWNGLWRAALGGAAGVALMLAPMVLSGGGPSMFDFFLNAVGHHPIVSVDAHNLWWLLMRGEIDVEDTLPVWQAVPWLSYRLASLLLFALFYALAAYRLWRAGAAEQWWLMAFAAFAFFILPTEIHENYGFAVLAFVLAGLPSNPRIIAALAVGLTLTMLLNYGLDDPGVYRALALHNPNQELAGLRLANSAAATALLAAWTVYVLRPRVHPARTPEYQGVA